MKNILSFENFVFLFQAVVNFERYREKFRLYGHDLDVFHLEWSKDGRFLASCGMCARVIIWDAQRLPSKVFP